MGWVLAARTVTADVEPVAAVARARFTAARAIVARREVRLAAPRTQRRQVSGMILITEASGELVVRCDTNTLRAGTPIGNGQARLDSRAGRSRKRACPVTLCSRCVVRL